MAYEPKKDDRFTTGLWCTAFNGREVFGTPVRPPRTYSSDNAVFELLTAAR